MFFKKQKIAEEPLIPKQKSTFALSSDYGRGISSYKFCLIASPKKPVIVSFVITFPVSTGLSTTSALTVSSKNFLTIFSFSS